MAKANRNHVGTLRTLGYFYRFTWRHNKRYPLYLVLSILLKAVVPFPNIMFPKYIIDELIGGKSIEKLVLYTALLIGSNLVISSLLSVCNHLLQFINMRTNKLLDFVIINKAMAMDYEHIENASVLNMSEKATSSMKWGTWGMYGVTSKTVEILAGIITLAGLGYVFSTVEWWIVALVLLFVASNMYFGAKLSEANHRFWGKMSGYNRMFDYFRGILKDFKFGKDIRLYDASGLILSRQQESIQFNRKISGEWSSLNVKYNMLFNFLNVLQQMVLYGYFAAKVFANAITIGSFTMYIAAASALKDSIENVFGETLRLREQAKYLAEFVRFAELEDVKPRGQEALPAERDFVIEFRKVSFKYPGSSEMILKDFSITIPFGQKLSVVGMNGAGKTTFIKLLTRLYDPTEGQILLNGVDIRTIELAEYEKLFSVVFQDFAIFAFSMKENIQMTMGDQAEKLQEVIDKAGLTSVVETLDKGVDTAVYKYFDEDGVEFSGGETQKIALARSLYKDAPVVVLDEPTAALDPIAEYEIYNRFNEIISGKTAVYISHRLSSCRFCDVIAVFHQGRLIQYGSHDELMLEPEGKYAEMFNAQAQYYVDEGTAQAG
ncbi:ABC transporter ATP-binding protein [Paenibacillus lignilyticus]|uniref:ABC transporter ATP-binding protein n=1 Tax=Paenibacillus lignilyticus TaxID=1172615 RepID=A0ABS5CGB8_9BACL|nr:ABC transporter ATP-binding protein [Paenibacillus lignilyticus]MBP3964871.1 ABC transporter ATP-binding protein [Paenibacillus lignilyticus]